MRKCYTNLMSDSWLNHLPSHEREKIRKRLRSPEEYERLREKVKGPEDLEKEMRKSEQLAELNFAMESEPKVKEALKKQVEKDMKEQGIESILESHMSPEAKNAIEQGKFILQVSSHPQTHQDALVAIPEGNVQEKIPVKPQLSDKYVAQLFQSA